MAKYNNSYFDHTYEVPGHYNDRRYFYSRNLQMGHKATTKQPDPKRYWPVEGVQAGSRIWIKGKFQLNISFMRSPTQRKNNEPGTVIIQVLRSQRIKPENANNNYEYWMNNPAALIVQNGRLSTDAAQWPDDYSGVEALADIMKRINKRSVIVAPRAEDCCGIARFFGFDVDDEIRALLNY